MEKIENKISAEQLEKLNELVKTINQGQNQIGNIEIQKHLLLHEVAKIQADLQAFQKELDAEYGKISINLQDGSYKEIVEDETDTQN